MRPSSGVSDALTACGQTPNPEREFIGCFARYAAPCSCNALLITPAARLTPGVWSSSDLTRANASVCVPMPECSYVTSTFAIRRMA